MTKNLGVPFSIAVLTFGVALAWLGADRISAAGALQEAALAGELSPALQEALVVEPTLVAAMPRKVRESSGLILSDRYPVFWTHNDSGDGAILYAVDSTGSFVGRARLDGVRARDFEDLGKGPCPQRWMDEPYCLYVADTGNNDRGRRVMSIYVLPEPEPTQEMAVVEPARLRFAYPDQRSDVEAIAVAADGNIVLVSKGRRGGIRGYRIEASAVEDALDSESLAVVDALGILPLEPDSKSRRLITGGTYAGSLLVLRTYEGIYGFDYGAGEWSLRGVCTIRPREPAGEAIAFAANSRFYLSSEAGGGRYPSIRWVDCPLER